MVFRQDQVFDLGEAHRAGDIAVAVEEFNGARGGIAIRINGLVDHAQRAAIRQIERIIVVAAGAAVDHIARGAAVECIGVVVAGHGVGAFAAEDRIVALVAEDHIIAFAADKHIIARFGDAIVARRDGVEGHISDPDLLVGVFAVVVVDLDTGHGACDLHEDRADGVGGVDGAAVLGGHGIARHALTARGGQGHIDGISGGVIGAHGDDIDMGVGVAAHIHVIETEGDIARAVGIERIGGVKGQRGDRGVVDAAFAACPVKSHAAIAGHRLARRDILCVGIGADGCAVVLGIKADSDVHAARADHGAVADAADAVPIEDLRLDRADGTGDDIAIADERVVARTANEQIVARFAVERIIAVAAVERIIARVAIVAFAHYGRVKEHIGDVDAAVVIAGLGMGDHQIGHRPRDIHKDRMRRIGIRARAAIAVGGLIAARAVFVGQGHAGAAGDVHIQQVARSVVGFDDHFAVIVDVIDAEGNIAHRSREGQLVIDAFVLVIQFRAERRIAVDGFGASVDRMDLLLVGRESGFGAVIAADHREGDIDTAGVLGETAQGIAVIDRAGGMIARVRCQIPLKAFADRTARAAGRSGQGAVAIDHIIACAARNGIVAAASIDLIVAFAGQNGVIAVACGNDIVLRGFAWQKRIVVVDHVAIGIARIGHIDQIITIRAFDDTVATVDHVFVKDRDIVDVTFEIVVVLAVVIFARAEGEVLVVIVANGHIETRGREVLAEGCAVGDIFDDKGAARGFVPRIGNTHVVASSKEMVSGGEQHLFAICIMHHFDGARLGHLNVEIAFGAAVTPFAAVDQRIRAGSDMGGLGKLDHDRAGIQIEGGVFAAHIETVVVTIKAQRAVLDARTAVKLAILGNAIGQTGVELFSAARKIPQTDQIFRIRCVEIIVGCVHRIATTVVMMIVVIVPKPPKSHCSLSIPKLAKRVSDPLSGQYKQT